MPTAWRIVKRRHAGSAFDGEGARRYGGRWNSPGTSVVYTAESRALALLEILAGMGAVEPLTAYALISVTFDDSIVTAVDLTTLPKACTENPPYPSTQRIGDEWVRKNTSSILKVPSAIVPQEYNYILNPSHPGFEQIEIGKPQEIAIDSRLTR